MADARIQITADSSQAEATMRRLGDSATGLGNRFLSLTGLAGGLGGALSIGAFAAFIKNTIDGIDALNDFADATGSSVEMLSALEDRAARTGTSMDTVGAALVKFNQTLEAAKPGSSAELALKAIGLNAEELKKIDPAEALRQTAMALSGYADDGNKARLVQELFGKSVREVAPLLKDLAEGGELVAKVTSEQAAQAEAFNKQLAELKKNITDVSRSLVSDLVTGLNAAAKAFKEGGLIEGLQTLMTGDDQFKNNKSLVENTDKLLRLENALLAARAQGYAENSRNIQNLKAQLEETKAALGTNMAFAKVQENGPTGTPAAPDAPKKTVGTVADPAALKAAQAEADKLRQQDIANLVKHAEEVDRANFAEAEALAKKQTAEADQEAASEQAWQQRTAERLAQIQTANMSREELERGHLATIQRDLEAARMAGFITEQQYNEMVYQETIKSKAKLGDAMSRIEVAGLQFARMNAKQKTDFVIAEAVRMTQGVATTNKELFEINKISGIAQASIALYEGTSKTWNAYPYPWNIPMTALHVATGLAQIQAISSAQFGSSTSAPTIAGGGATPVFNAADAASPVAPLPAPNAQIEPPEQLLSITFAGSGRYTQEEIVDGLLPALEAAWANGAGRTRMNVTYS